MTCGSRGWETNPTEKQRLSKPVWNISISKCKHCKVILIYIKHSNKNICSFFKLSDLLSTYIQIPILMLLAGKLVKLKSTPVKPWLKWWRKIFKSRQTLFARIKLIKTVIFSILRQYPEKKIAKVCKHAHASG